MLVGWGGRYCDALIVGIQKWREFGRENVGT